MLFGESTGPGVYCLPHIIYLLIAIPLMIVGIILAMKFVKDERHSKILIKITAGVLLALIITNRIAYTYQRVVIEGGTIIVDGEKLHYTWGYLLPETFCGLSALSFSLAVLFLKKDNILLHALTYFGLLSGLASSFFPVYLNRQGFFELGTMTSLIFHVVLSFLSFLVILKKYMIPNIKKWYAVPIVYAFFCLIAVFETQVLGTPEKEAMSVFEPLVAQLPHLTMWYSIGIALTVLIIVALYLYEHFANHKNFKTITSEWIPLTTSTRPMSASVATKENRTLTKNVEKKIVKSKEIAPIKKATKSTNKKRKK